MTETGGYQPCDDMLEDQDRCGHPANMRYPSSTLANGDGSVSILFVCARCGNGEWVEYEADWNHGVDQ